MNNLNEKLAKWAGIHWMTWINHPEHGTDWFLDGYDGKSSKEPPNFVESLDACFEWLVPKAIEKIKNSHDVNIGDSGAYIILFERWLREGHDALALCKVIDQLIEKGG